MRAQPLFHLQWVILLVALALLIGEGRDVTDIAHLFAYGLVTLSALLALSVSRQAAGGHGEAGPPPAPEPTDALEQGDAAPPALAALLEHLSQRSTDSFAPLSVQTDDPSVSRLATHYNAAVACAQREIDALRAALEASELARQEAAQAQIFDTAEGVEAAQRTAPPSAPDHEAPWVSALTSRGMSAGGFCYRALWGTFRANARGGLLDCNPTLSKMLAYPSSEAALDALAEAPGTFLGDLALWRQIGQALDADGSVQVMEGQLLCANQRALRIRLTAWRGDDPDQIEGIIEDVSACHLRQQAMREEAQDLAARQAKSEVLAVLSHEIRTPLNGVLGTLDLLDQSELDHQQQIYLSACRRSAKRLSAMLADLMDYSRLEAGHFQLDESPFSPRELLGLLAVGATEAALGKGLSFDLQIGPNLPESLLGDGERLTQILGHLLDNAIKFTDEGVVTVSADLRSAISGQAVIRFEIQDTGVGLQPDQQALLLSGQQHINSSNTRSFDGVGLGLALCRRLTDLMKGKIGVDSALGRGSTFWVDLPFELIDSDAEIHPADIKDRRVLLVDDGAYSRYMMVMQMADWPLKVSSAESEASALAALEKAQREGDPFCALLLNLARPDGSLAFAQRLLKRPGLIPLPIVLLAPQGYTLDQARRNRAGVHTVLHKPLAQEALRLRVEQAILNPKRGVSRDTATELPRLPKQSSRGEKTVLLAEDNPLNRTVAREMLIRAGFNCLVANDGAEAEALFKAERVDLILMDCQMPNVDGFEATARIRALEAGARHTPIVALTANTIIGHRNACIAAGMDDHLTKPVQPTTLIRLLDRILGLPEAPIVSKDTIPTADLLEQLDTHPEIPEP